MSDNWEYTCSKGVLHKCEVDEECEPDNRKLFHTVHHPERGSMSADISPYQSGREVLELWIEAGYPHRLWGAWNLPMLIAYLAGKNNWPENLFCFNNIPALSHWKH